MIRIRDTLIPADLIQQVSLVYHNELDVYFIYVDGEKPQAFQCVSREQGEQELEQIRADYMAIVWGE